VNQRIINIALKIKYVIKKNFIFPFVLVGQQEKPRIFACIYHDFGRLDLSY
jgi:hypothetical protein